MDALARIEQVCRTPGLGERELRVAVLGELGSIVPFDAHAWLLTDPHSCVGWSPVAEIPDLADLPDVIRAKYTTSFNRWTGLTPGVAETVARATADDRLDSPLWRLVESKYAVADVASVVLRDKAGCWGFVDLWRRDGAFEAAECDLLGAVATLVTPVLRRALLPTFAAARDAAVDGPVVLLLGDDLRAVAQTEPTGPFLEALLPAGPGRSAVPAAGLNVAAQLCAVEAGIDDRPPEARIFVPGRSWMTIRAGRIGRPETGGAAIAVTIEPTRPSDRARLYASVAGLTERELAVLEAIAAGNDTRRTAQCLGISEHTVQDHLKAIFAKTGADSRRQLIARAIGSAP